MSTYVDVFYFFHISRTHKFGRAKVRIIMCCHLEEMELNVVRAFFPSVCVFILSRRYTRSTILATSDIFASNQKRQWMSSISLGATGDSLRKTFKNFFWSWLTGRMRSRIPHEFDRFLRIPIRGKNCFEQVPHMVEGDCQTDWGYKKKSLVDKCLPFPNNKKSKKLLTSVLQTKICSHSCEFYSRSVSLHIGMKGNNKK